jgi:hypothetical protein
VALATTTRAEEECLAGGGISGYRFRVRRLYTGAHESHKLVQFPLGYMREAGHSGSWNTVVNDGADGRVGFQAGTVSLSDPRRALPSHRIRAVAASAANLKLVPARGDRIGGRRGALGGGLLSGPWEAQQSAGEL